MESLTILGLAILFFLLQYYAFELFEKKELRNKLLEPIKWAWKNEKPWFFLISLSLIISLLIIIFSKPCSGFVDFIFGRSDGVFFSPTSCVSGLGIALLTPPTTVIAGAFFLAPQVFPILYLLGVIISKNGKIKDNENISQRSFNVISILVCLIVILAWLSYSLYE